MERIIIPVRKDNLQYLDFKRLIGFLNQFFDHQENVPNYSYLFTMGRTQLFKACDEYNLSQYIGKVELQTMDQVNVLGKIFKVIARFMGTVQDSAECVQWFNENTDQAFKDTLNQISAFETIPKKLQEFGEKC